MVTPHHLTDLAKEDRRKVEAWLAEFDQAWDEKRLGAQVRKLPPAGDPRRLPALVEMAKIDLRRQWQKGRHARVEAYLKALPELGAADVIVELLLAEIKVRQRAGAAVDMADIARRFPDHAGRLGQPAPTLSDPVGPTPTTVAPTPRQVRRSGPAHATPASPPSLPEQFGRYRIGKKLGQGGMGSVYLAHDSELDRQVALKVPLFGEADGPEILERFYREARAAATLSHPNICPVFDVGTIEGIHYVTMAYVEGKTLSDLIRGGERLPQKAVAAVVRKLALAMQEAHSHGVIHRDLKPSNVMINKRNEPVIMDFGLARRAQENARLTRSGSVLGTPAYMAPEQVQGDPKAVGPASDIYSLGVILYEMLTGQLPFSGPVMAVLGQVLTQESPRPSSLRPDLDPALEAICLKAMAKKVSERYASMRDFAAALTGYLKGGGGAKPAAGKGKARPSAEGVAVAEAAPPGADSLATDLLAKLAHRLEADAETIRESQRLAAQQHRASCLPWLVTVLVLLAVVGVGGYAVVAFLNRGQAPPVVNVNPAVTVQLTLPKEAADPTFVVFLVDGTAKTKEELAAPIKLTPGEHELKMQRKDGTFVVSTFTVGNAKQVPVPPPIDGGGAPPAVEGPAGNERGAGDWVSLFNGKDLDGWTIYPEGTTGWEVKEGVLQCSGPVSQLFSQRSDYKNFHFRVEAMINDGGLSAQCFRAKFGAGPPMGYRAAFNATGPDATFRTGSLSAYRYGNSLLHRIDKALVRPDTWFTQEVIANGNQLTVLLNGEKVSEEIDVEKTFSGGFFAFWRNDQGTVLKLRKIEARELPPARPVVRPGAEPGWTPLFNGKDLSGWKGFPRDTTGWEVRDGVLRCSGPVSQLFSERGDYENFHFRVEAKVNHGGTSAQAFRAQFAQGIPVGYKAALSSTGSDVTLRTGSLYSYRYGASRLGAIGDILIKPDVWFTQEVIAQGNHLVVKLNGETTADVIDPDNSYRKGHFALERADRDTVVMFRTIEVKELPPSR